MDWVIYTTIVCIIFSFILAGRQINSHLNSYTNPDFQRRIIMILLMPPIYALFSSLNIWLKDHNGMMLLVRDIYESIVIYSFFQLLRSYVGYDFDKKRVDDQKIYQALGSKGLHHHSFPFSLFLKPMDLTSVEAGQQVFKQVKIGILQYIPVKIFTCLVDLMDLAEWGNTIANNIVYYSCSALVFVSVSIALYYLVFFFHILHEELQPYNPLVKFLTIKGVLFLTFWQEMILWFCSTPIKNSRFLPKEEREDGSEVLSSLLVNIEMVIMTFLTAWTYSSTDFKTGENAKRQGLRKVLRENFSFVKNELKEVANELNKKKDEQCSLYSLFLSLSL